MNSNGKNIDAWFSAFGRTMVRRRWIVIIVVLIVTVISGLGLPDIVLDTSMENWFSDKAAVNQRREQFEKHFQNSDFVAFLVESEDVFSTEIFTLLAQLGSDLLETVPFADEVTSLVNVEYSHAVGEEIVIEELVPDPIPDDTATLEDIRAKALSKESIGGRLVSMDSTQTWLILRLLPFPEGWEGQSGEAGGKEPVERKEAGGNAPGNAPVEDPGESGEAGKNTFGDPPYVVVGKSVEELMNKERYSGYSIKSTGAPILMYQELIYTEQEMGKLLAIVVVISIVLLILFLRSFSGVAVPFLATVVSLVILFGAMGHLGIKINSFLVSIPMFLGFVLAIGYSIHMFNYFNRAMLEGSAEHSEAGPNAPIREEAGSKGVRRGEAVAMAVGSAGWPILFTALTTLVALLSFLAVGLVPLQWLGLASASLVLIIYVIIMTLTPALLSFGGRTKQAARTSKRVLFSNQRSDRVFTAMGKWIFAHDRLLLLVFVAVVAILIIGLTRFQVNLDIEKAYGRKVPYANRMLEVAESKVGSFSSYDITFEFPGTEKAKDPEVLQALETFQSEVENLPLTKRTTSLLMILKDMNRLLHQGDDAYYTIPQSQALVAQILFLYEMAGGANQSEWVSDNFSMLRLQVETDDLDSKQMLREIEQINRLKERLFPDATMSITGTMLEYALLNQYIGRGQIVSFLIALGIIAILMMIVFRSVKTGLIGLIPNLTPALAVGGLMGFLGIPLDFITITIIPMILGLAVDDTIHFITHVHREYDTHGGYVRASVSTLRVVGRALFMTSAVVIVSFAGFISSGFNMMQNLGIFLGIGLATALLTDYFITPLLLEKTGAFGPQKGESTEEHS